MTFGEEMGQGANREVSRQIYDAYREVGGNFIDTANIYTLGTSERMVGEFIAKERDQLVVATKYSMSTNMDDPNAKPNIRAPILYSLKATVISSPYSSY